MLKVYIHEPSDTLGIAEETWDYIVLVKFVPFARRVYKQSLVVDYNDPIAYVEHPIAEAKTDEWVVIGDF